MQHRLPTTPGALIGYTKHGKPIHVAAGGSQPVDPVPPTPPAPPPDPGPPQDVASLPDWAQKLIHDARGEAAKHRTAGRTAADDARAAALKDVAKALGLAGDDKPVDPAELTAQIQAAQSAQFTAACELNLVRAAGSLGLNVDEAMDSNRFMDAFADALEESGDVTTLNSGELSTAVQAAAVKALEKYPKFRTGGQAPAPASTQGAPRPDPSQGSRTGVPAIRHADLAGAVNAFYGQQRR